MRISALTLVCILAGACAHSNSSTALSPTNCHLTEAEMDAWIHGHVLIGQDDEVTDPVHGQTRRLEVGFHLNLDDLLTQLDHWITDRSR